MAQMQLDEAVLEDLYSWIDQIPLSRPKRDLRRDFSDGVLVAEVIKHFFPSVVEKHNYSSALGVNKKLVNWQILNRKVFRKMGFEVNDDVVRTIVDCQPFAVEHFLIHLRVRIDQLLAQKVKSSSPEADQSETDSLHDPFIRKTVSTQPVTGSQRIKTTVAKTCESDNFSPDYVITRDGMTTSHKFFGSVPKSLPGEAQLREILEEKNEQLLIKDEAIELLETKVHRLEQLLQLKDIRIEDLHTRLSEERTANSALARKKHPRI